MNKSKLAKPSVVPPDEDLLRAYKALPEDTRAGWAKHTDLWYAIAEAKRTYRQAHVMEHWDEEDRRILFRLILGQTPKRMEDELGMSRQAIESRINKMLKRTGLTERAHLILWFLGFITLSLTDKKLPGTTLIESIESDRHLLQSSRLSRQK